ncbi:transposon Ty3-I Gag-Pol polyprotein [Trichonephila clavata]|uniref:Transposon Ty3-I Gag-Pol polyprotein n=1 Tax=Trichonephila clavata TaxID=2740835 RepID=A0A8X6LEA6_TRICU|nr:transposon Ty3-I Gag-Pol polyprotein [Trichonephila clavata]
MASAYSACIWTPYNGPTTIQASDSVKRQQLEHEAERQRLGREAEQQRLEREAEQRRLEREAEAEQRQIELQRLEIRRLELQAAPAATTPPGRTEEVHHKIPLAQITPKFDEKKDEMSLFLVNFERRAEMARVPREEWAKAPEDIKDHFFGEWLELKQPEELATKFDEFESLKDSLRNNHHGRKQNESRPSHNDKSRFQDNRRKLSDNHARFRDNRGKYNDNHGRSTENHTRFYDKRQTKTEPGGRGSMPAQSKTSGQKNFRCYECDSPDHLRNACPELRRSQGNEINTHSDTHPVHIVNEVPEEAIEYPDVDLQKFTRQVKIGDFVVTALLDTGSVRNLIRFDVYKRMNPKNKLWRESTVLTGLGQGQVKTLGSFRHVAEIDGHVCRLDFQVVPSAALKFEAIIGSAFLAHAPCPFHEEKVKPESPDWIFNISKKEEQDELDLRHIQNAEIACRVEDMVSSYQPKKTESTDVSMKIILEDEIPVYERARRLVSRTTRGQ